MENMSDKEKFHRCFKCHEPLKITCEEDWLIFINKGLCKKCYEEESLEQIYTDSFKDMYDRIIEAIKEIDSAKIDLSLCLAGLRIINKKEEINESKN